MERRGLFVGIGIDAYDSHEPLHHAVAEVKAVAEVLGADFAGEPLLDPDLAHVLEHLKTVPGCLDTGSLVLLWCGHGVQSGTKLWLQTRNDCGKINAADVIARCAESGVASCSTECVSLCRFVSFRVVSCRSARPRSRRWP